MAPQYASGRVLAWAFTVAGLALVWLAIVISLPSRQELAAKEPALSLRPVPASTAKSLSEPTLDLSIPGVPAAPPAPSDQDQSGAFDAAASTAPQRDLQAAQVARLRCEADIEQLCSDSPEGPARKKCMEKRAQHLPVPCQQQLHERFVRWKEERGRLMTACHADVKRWCPLVKPGDGQILQCLQKHAQELSDRCYETLPKGTVYFKQ